MNAYRTQIRMNLRLVLRNRIALAFSYGFPLIFFFIFGQLGGRGGGAGLQILNMVLGLGVLGSGLFGVGMRATADREQNVLRRFKVAPINAGPILVSGLLTGLTLQLPNIVFMIVMAHQFYGAPWPTQPVSLLLIVSLGLLAFSSIGAMIASVVNSMQEGVLLTQLFYFPMLFLSGVTFPVSVMPPWLQSLAQFIPMTHFTSALQPILRGRESFLDNLPSAGALALTTVVATFLGLKLFRWEKEEKLKPAAKLWLLAVLGPFFVMGAWQTHAKTNIVKAKIVERTDRRNETTLIHDARVIVGDGTVLDRASVMIRGGKIAEIYKGQGPDVENIKASVVEAAGKTLLPGLIDVHVHLGSPGGVFEDASNFTKTDDNIDRALAAYLYSGVTAVKSAGDALDTVLKHRATTASGERLGAELFAVGPMFTTEGGHGTEVLQYLPENTRATVEPQLLRMPKSAEEARTQVAQLKARGVDGIKVILEAGGGSRTFNRMDPALVRAVAEAARATGLPVVAHTGNVRDITDALDAGVNGIEHGTPQEAIPDALFARMKELGVTYDPTLAVYEALQQMSQGKTDLLEQTLVQQVGPPDLLQGTKAMFAGRAGKGGGSAVRTEIAKQNLANAYRAGVMLVTGTDAGNQLVFHGPGVHRELKLWVEAGVPSAAALQAATHNSALLLNAANRMGMIKQGYEASLFLVEGNPLQEMGATEHITDVFFKGERVRRSGLFDQK